MRRALLLILALFPLDAQATPLADEVARLAKPLVEREQVHAVAIGLYRAGKRETYGFGAVRPGGPAPGAHTTFEIGSITKVFTALILADAAARGEVTLEEPVSRLLPGWTIPTRSRSAITLTQLTTHTSGIPRMPPGFTATDPRDPYKDYDEAKLRAFLAGYALPRAPGAAYEYSNLGVSLLGLALVQRIGRPLEALYAERVIRPLGMTETSLARLPDVQGYDDDGDPTPPWTQTSTAACGALRGSVSDLLQLISAELDPPKGTLGDGLRAAIDPRYDDGKHRVALGWHFGRPDAPSTVWHNGGTGGFSSFVGFDPAARVGVAILASGRTDFVDKLGDALLTVVHGGTATLSPPPVVKLSAAQLDALVGDFALSPAFHLVVTRAGDRLYLQATGQPRFRLYPDGPDSARIRVVDARLTFERGADAGVAAAVLHQGGRDQRATRVAP